MGEQGELFSLLHSGPACPAGFQVVECGDDHDVGDDHDGGGDCGGDDHLITMTNQVKGNKCMKLDKTELGWAAARNVCKEAGADLALVIYHHDYDVDDDDCDDDDDDDDS